MAKILLLFITLLFVGVTPTPTSYTLERAFPVKHDIPISKLRERDIIRHRRLLQQSGGGDVFDFPLEGDSVPYHIGLYYTKVQLGTPPRDYYVQIDTGSNVLWVNCKSCNGCPTSSRQHIPVEFYDSSSSSTSSLITCSDSLCSQGSQWSRPYYQVNLQSISVNGQTLSIDPSTFSNAGNHTGTIIDSGTTLAFLPPDALTLLKDAMLQLLSKGWDASYLTSGFTVCTARYFKGRWVLYIQLEIALSVSSIFPLVSLNFQGGSSMHIRPQDYLLQDNSKGGAEVWCFGFQSYLTPGPTVLGDLVLKDKIIVYDLGGQRLGWSDYNCSSSVNVSSTSSNAGQIGSSTSFPMLILASILQYALTFSILSQ
ncbi:aspartic proteinase-like protein 2 [Artemisia annua]|uniref:Aspartic proteinase-like protein 2 n=1 Tax=Artemisia annua TaxID=35608 RepID=A0A2U1M3B8_ARTAN|nr:aspartic proteinase-like protein 2 [Artemisia annua]